ncbi:MAG: NIPSNAP family protein [Limisphaerales bacterium]
MKRREFLTTTLAASTLAGLGTASLTARAAALERAGRGKREYYELRIYRLKNPANRGLLEGYIEKAAIPALNRLGVKPVGVFVQQERAEAPGSTEVRDANSVLVLRTYPSLEVLAKATARLSADAEYQRAGADYLNSPKTNPAFDRIDSWLMLAFAGLPKIELPAYSRERKPRMFELRTYESYSELKALKKVEMFNAGEIGVMREVGLAPIFYGQVLIGHDLPHLTYMVSGENQDEHKKHWGAFGAHPTWNKLKNDPQYADTVSKITNRFLVPTSYSQI